MWKFLFLALMAQSVMAQAQSGFVDSVLTHIRKQPDDTNKVRMYEDLFYDENHFAAYDSNGLDQKLAYITEMLQLSQRLDYKRGIAEGHNCAGIIYEWISRAQPKKDKKWMNYINTALENYYIARELFNEAGYVYNSGGTAANIGMLIYRTGRKQRGLDTLLAARHMLSGFKDSVFYANTLEAVGIVYQTLNKYDRSLENLVEAKRTYEHTGKRKYLAMAHLQIAETLAAQKKYDKALLYVNKGLEFAPESDYKGAMRVASTMMENINKRRR